jgi:hypothetical protein
VSKKLAPAFSWLKKAFDSHCVLVGMVDVLSVPRFAIQPSQPIRPHDGWIIESSIVNLAETPFGDLIYQCASEGYAGTHRRAGTKEQNGLDGPS